MVQVVFSKLYSVALTGSTLFEEQEVCDIIKNAEINEKAQHFNALERENIFEK